MILNDLHNKGLIPKMPKFLLTNTQYLALTGSVTYGCSTDDSDIDLIGFAIPKKEDIFPHLKGEIVGFGNPKPQFQQWQKHAIKDGAKEYDCVVYNIVKYFNLLMANNPNMVDSLFVPLECIVHSTESGRYVRENRKTFLHKGAYKKFSGYAYSQLHKIELKQPKEGSNRYKVVEKFGYDVKFAYHIIRLMNEIEQILMYGDLDLQRDREILKAIRRGEWTIQELKMRFKEKETHLEELYHKSTAIPDAPDETKIKQILIDCLEMQYGSLENAIKQEKDHDKMSIAIQQIRDICDTL